MVVGMMDTDIVDKSWIKIDEAKCKVLGGLGQSRMNLSSEGLSVVPEVGSLDVERRIVVGLSQQRLQRKQDRLDAIDRGPFLFQDVLYQRGTDQRTIQVYCLQGRKTDQTDVSRRQSDVGMKDVGGELDVGSFVWVVWREVEIDLVREASIGLQDRVTESELFEY